MRGGSLLPEILTQDSDDQSFNEETKPKRVKFTPYEDEIIRNFIKQYGKNNWNLITNFLPNKTPEACRTRYCRYISKEGTLNYNYTYEEDALIYEMRAKHGAKWKDIAKLLKGKTCYMIKNRYSHIIHVKFRKEKIKKPHRTASIIYEPEIMEVTNNLDNSPTDSNEKSKLNDSSELNSYEYITISKKHNEKLPSILNLPFIDPTPKNSFSNSFFNITV